jgi:hypothetical protein
VLVALSASAPLPASRSIASQASTTATVEAILAVVGGHPFGVSRTDWRREHRSATWQTYRGSPDDIRSSAVVGPDGMWCTTARDRQRQFEREAVFYALREEAPLDCRLEELRVTVDRAAGADAYDGLSKALGGRFGDPTVAQGDWQRAAPWLRFGGYWGRLPGRWKDVRYWEDGTRYIFLYRDEGRLEVLARSAILNVALADPPPSAIMSRYGVDRLTWALVNGIRARFPEAASIISQDTVADQDAVERTALALLAALQRATTVNDRAMLALAAAQALGKFHLRGPTPVEARPSVAAVLAYGVRFAESPYDDDIWYYDGGHIDDVIARHPGTFWGQLAFVHRLDEGWVRECVPSFDEVILQGTRWLEKYPHSEFAARVIFDVAQAYEARWSWSVAPAEDEPVGKPRPRGDDPARLQAIAWYDRVVALAPSSIEATQARRRRLQLRLGIDTGQRRFCCEYA